MQPKAPYFGAKSPVFDRHDLVKRMVHTALHHETYSKPVFIADFKKEADIDRVKEHIMIYVWERDFKFERESYIIGLNGYAMVRLLQTIVHINNREFWNIYQEAKPIIVDFAANNVTTLCRQVKMHPRDVFKNVRLCDAA